MNDIVEALMKIRKAREAYRNYEGNLDYTHPTRIKTSTIPYNMVKSKNKKAKKGLKGKYK